MERFIVTKSFQDRYTRKYYGVGSIFESSDADRIAELERGGYIAPENTDMAATAMQEGKVQEQAQANAKELASAYEQARQAIEPKTVVNGKVVPLKQAQSAEAMFEGSVKQTGIQQAHNNSTEPVQSGQVAQNSQQNAMAKGLSAENKAQNLQQLNVANVQSGQAELEQHMQNAQGGSTSNNMNQQQQMNQTGAQQFGYENSTAQQENLTSNMAGNINSSNVSQTAKAESEFAQAKENSTIAAHETASQGAQAVAEQQAKAKGTARTKREQ